MTTREEIKKYIEDSKDRFFNYLRNKILDESSFGTLMALSETQGVYIFSGVIRDFLLNMNWTPRDLDFVIKHDFRPTPIVSRYLRGADIEYKLNSFKGLKIHNGKGLDIDAWILGNTWGLKHLKNKEQTPNALLKTVFFNFQAIVYDLQRRKFIFDDAFVNFLDTNTIDIVYEENPHIPLCLYNIFHYAIKLGSKLSVRLRKWIDQHYSDDIDFDKVQRDHVGKIMYASADIHKFLNDRKYQDTERMKIYNIDWSKYLSDDRVKESQPLPEDGIDKRNPFESDFGRVVFSSALRRMHDKAQVIPLTSGDVVHTRLTHSIEVMNAAQSLASNLCRDKDFIAEYGLETSVDLERKISAILKTAAFVHDIGNPPFGHFGESVIQDYFKKLLNNHILCDRFKPDFEEFDGNAQGFRILTKLSYVGHLSGLNLTYATLAAYMKYPNAGRKDKSYIGTKKHGVFITEEYILNQVVKKCHLRTETGRIKRHPLSFLVEAADSICYNVMDIEDGYTQHWYEKDQMITYLDQEITSVIQKNIKEGKKVNANAYYDKNKKQYSFLKIISKELSDKQNESWNHSHWIVSFRVAAIQYLIEKANSNFKKNIHDIDAGTYSRELIDDDVLGVSQALQNFTCKHIFPRRIIEKAELTGHSVIRGLLDILIEYVSSSDIQFRKRVKSVLSKSSLRVAIHESRTGADRNSSIVISDEELADFDVATLSENAKLRLVVDFISGMTDKFAVQLYQQLSGHKI